MSGAKSVCTITKPALLRLLTGPSQLDRRPHRSIRDVVKPAIVIGKSGNGNWGSEVRVGCAKHQYNHLPAYLFQYFPRTATVLNLPVIK